MIAKHDRTRWFLGVLVVGCALFAGIGAGALWMAMRLPRPTLFECPSCPACPQPALAAASPPISGMPKRAHRVLRTVALPNALDVPPEHQARLRLWIDKQAETLRSCGDGSVHGRALLALDVDGEGNIRRTELLAHDPLPDSVTDCITSRAGSWQSPIAEQNRLLVNLVL